MLQDTEGKRGGTEIQSSLPAPSSRQGPLRPGLPPARPVATSLKHHQVEVPAPHPLWLLGRALGGSPQPPCPRSLGEGPVVAVRQATSIFRELLLGLVVGEQGDTHYLGSRRGSSVHPELTCRVFIPAVYPGCLQGPLTSALKPLAQADG